MIDFDFLGNYFGRVAEAFQFLVALFSMLGLLALIIGVLGAVLSGSRHRAGFVKVIVVSLIIVVICGPYTGMKYFRIY